MIARLALSSSLLLALAARAGAQGIEYADGTTRYRVSTTTTGSQTTPLGSSKFELGVQQQITLNVAHQAKDTLLATVTLDSISLTGAASVADISSLRGAKFVSLVSPTGHVYSTRAPTSVDPVASQLAEAIVRILPAYQPNLKQGVTWADTSSGKVTQQGMELDRTVVSNFVV